MSSLVDEYASRNDNEIDENEESEDSDVRDEVPQSNGKKRRRDADGASEDGINGNAEEDSSEEESDDDEEEAARIREGFIVDDEEDNEEPSPRHKRRKLHKRRSREKSEELDLDEDDLALVDEALGRTPRERPSEHQFKRLRQGRDGALHQASSENLALGDLFSDDEQGNDATGTNYNRRRAYVGARELMEDEFADFIEDDEPPDEDDLDQAAREEEERFIRQHRRQQHVLQDLPADIDQDAYDEVQEIFGDGHDYDWAMEVSEDEDQLPEVEELSLADEEKGRRHGVELKDIFEPSELEARMLTDRDEIIRITDEPERFQLARPAETTYQLTEQDASLEQDWITAKLLARPYKIRIAERMEPTYREAVGATLRFFNEELLEVPFIWQQRKDFLLFPDKEKDPATGTIILKGLSKLLDQDDLWLVFEWDLRYRAFCQQKEMLRKTMERLGEHIDREEEIFSQQNWDALQTMEEVQDLHDYVYFRYSEELRELQALQANGSGRGGGFKKAGGNRFGMWERIRKGNIYHLVRAFGISANDFGLNIKANTRRVWTDDPSDVPEVLAEGYVTPAGYASASMALRAAMDMLSEEMFHNPQVRKIIRGALELRGTYTVKVTEKGIKKIDDGHPYYRFKYLTQQYFSQVTLRPDRFLQILKAEEEGLIALQVDIPDYQKLLDRLYELFASDNFSEVAIAWNALRKEVLKNALDKTLPLVVKSIKEQLRVECDEILAFSCRQAFSRKLDHAPYFIDDLKLDKGTPLNVLTVSNGKGDFTRDAVVCTFVDDRGKFVEQLRLPDIRELENKNAFVEFVDRRKPDMIGIAGFGVATSRLHDDIARLIAERKDENSALNKIIRYVNDECARLYMNSKSAEQEFPDLPPLVRYCISLGRYLQNPLLEYIALGRDVTNIPFHPHQGLLNDERLYRVLETAIVDIVNMVGVEINEAVRDEYRARALPYVSGLGPRKAGTVIKRINTGADGYLARRDELITKAIVSKSIFMNCASFMRIPYEKGGDREADPLDATRIHPEDYDLAKKMAADALELDEEDVQALERSEPGGVVKHLMEDDTEKLNDLILEEYADQLSRVFRQKKRNTLEQIKDELQQPYEELRRDFDELTMNEVFTMLTGETEETLKEGMVVPVVIRRVADRFAVGMMDCGVEGNIAQGNMSDNNLPGSIVFHVGQTLNALIEKLNRASFQAELITRQSSVEYGLRDMAKTIRRNIPEGEWDEYAEERDRNRLQAKREKENKTSRVIKHPLFRSFNYQQAENYLKAMQRGDAVIRPSSLGPDHIAVTWKVADGVYQHIEWRSADVLELDKANEFSVGRILRVGTYSYSDLDELIVNHVKSMARKVDEMLLHEKFKEGTTSETEDWLNVYHQVNSTKSIYAFCMDRLHPGYFDLCFKTSAKATVKSWPVKVVPGAFMLKDNLYADMTSLINGFKRLVTVALRSGR